MLERFKKKWNIQSNFQLVVVLIVFSITGSATLYVKNIIFSYTGIDEISSVWLKIPLYILIVFPVYQALFLIIGTLLGQFKFAWAFEKKMISRFVGKKK
jgi:hypothetical protein